MIPALLAAHTCQLWTGYICPFPRNLLVFYLIDMAAGRPRLAQVICPSIAMQIGKSRIMRPVVMVPASVDLH